jgi:hypothetical protein
MKWFILNSRGNSVKPACPAYWQSGGHAGETPGSTIKIITLIIAYYYSYNSLNCTPKNFSKILLLLVAQ